MKKLLILLTIVAGTAWFVSCHKDDERSSTPGTTHFSVRLTDAPTIYDSVIIDLQGVEVKNSNGTTVLLNAIPGLYNLLDYANGKDTLIASANLPSTTVSQVRLILGPNNYVVVGGVPYSMKTPSAQESGLKLNIHAALVPGVAYILTLDFDAAQSIVVTGNGSYILKPVIRVVSTATGGSISGIVAPPTALPATVMASNSAGNTYSTITNTAGQFLIAGIPVDVYTVIIYPAPPFLNDTISNVNVTLNTMTNLGTIVL